MERHYGGSRGGSSTPGFATLRRRLLLQLAIVSQHGPGLERAHRGTEAFV